MHVALQAIAEAVNSLPPVYAADFPPLHTAVSIVNKCHPLMMQTYKPVLTSGDGDCMYHALSRVICGSSSCQEFSDYWLPAYAAVKYRDVLISSLQLAFPLDTLDNHAHKANTLIVHALHIGTWGSDFYLSLLLDRPILTVCLQLQHNNAFIAVINHFLGRIWQYHISSTVCAFTCGCTVPRPYSQITGLAKLGLIARLSKLFSFSV